MSVQQTTAAVCAVPACWRPELDDMAAACDESFRAMVTSILMLAARTALPRTLPLELWCAVFELVWTWQTHSENGACWYLLRDVERLVRVEAPRVYACIGHKTPEAMADRAGWLETYVDTVRFGVKCTLKSEPWTMAMLLAVPVSARQHVARQVARCVFKECTRGRTVVVATALVHLTTHDSRWQNDAACPWHSIGWQRRRWRKQQACRRVSTSHLARAMRRGAMEAYVQPRYSSSTRKLGRAAAALDRAMFAVCQQAGLMYPFISLPGDALMEDQVKN